jgi:hypothetical protein
MKLNQRKIEDFHETEEAIFQRHQLNRIREFLLANEASEDLIDAIDEAIEDIESWISPEIATALGDGTPQSGNS